MTPSGVKHTHNEWTLCIIYTHLDDNSKLKSMDDIDYPIPFIDLIIFTLIVVHFWYFNIQIQAIY